MSARELPAVLWPNPLPLEGLKSRKRAIFSAPRAYFKSISKQSATSFSGLELTLESRVAIVGDRHARTATDLLLGARELVTGTVSRHDGLLVLHLGPQLLDSVEQFVEHYLAAAAAALEQRPQVVILDQAAGARNEAWSQAFQYLLSYQAVHEFRGALIICTSEETQAIKQICVHRWTGAGEWFWQELISEDDGLEFCEDVLSISGKEMLEERILQDVRDLAWKEPFVEDVITKAKDKGWNLTVLTRPADSASEKLPLQDASRQPDVNLDQQEQSEGTRALAGFICYKISDSTTFNIARLAVVESVRTSGYGRRLMRFAFEKAAQMAQSRIAWIGVSALDTAVPFYERFGFMDMTAEDVDAEEHFQTWMEMPNVSNVVENAVPEAPPLAHL